MPPNSQTKADNKKGVGTYTILIYTSYNYLRKDIY